MDRKARSTARRRGSSRGSMRRSARRSRRSSRAVRSLRLVVGWRIVDLRQWIFEEFRVVVAEQTLSRVLRKIGCRKLSARPRHYAQAEDAIEDFKKTFPRAWKRSGARRASSPPP